MRFFTPVSLLWKPHLGNYQLIFYMENQSNGESAMNPKTSCDMVRRLLNVREKEVIRVLSNRNADVEPKWGFLRRIFHQIDVPYPTCPIYSIRCTRALNCIKYINLIYLLFIFYITIYFNSAIKHYNKLLNSIK